MINIWNNMWKHWFLFLTLFMNFFYLHFQRWEWYECFAYPPQCVWMFFSWCWALRLCCPLLLQGASPWWALTWCAHVSDTLSDTLSTDTLWTPWWWGCCPVECRSPLTLPSALHVIRACRALEWVNDILARCENTSGSPKVSHFVNCFLKDSAD